MTNISYYSDNGYYTIRNILLYNYIIIIMSHNYTRNIYTVGNIYNYKHNMNYNYMI